MLNFLKLDIFLSDFLESKLGHNPSFVWRSICNSKFILRAGTRWRIGSGIDVSLLNENWSAFALTYMAIHGSDDRIPNVSDAE